MNLKKLLLISPLFLVGCNQPSQSPITAISGFGVDNRLITVVHDGHSFVVVMDGQRPKAIIHHPECQCLKTAE